MTTPNLDALNDLFTGVDADFDPNASNNPRPPLGRGRYMIKRFFVKPTTKQGNIIAVELAVVAPPPGATGTGSRKWDQVSLAFFVSKTGLAVKYEKARARDFTAAALMMPPGSETGPQQKRLCMPDNPGCGIMIDITASQNGNYMNYTFDAVPGQTPETILACKNAMLSAASTPPPYTGVPHAATGPAPANVPNPAATISNTVPVAAPAAAPAANPLAGLFPGF